MGAQWIDKEIYKQFIIEKFKVNGYQLEYLNLDYNTYTGVWDIEAPAWIGGIEVTTIFGTGRMNGFRIAEHCLNLKTPSIYDEEKTIGPDGNTTTKRILNKPETIAAREKQSKLLTEFKNWIFEDPDRREKLVKIYNDKFNNIRLANYDGSYLTFPEMNPMVELKPYQKDAVERVITNGNTLLHHVVGAGKTFEMVAAAMKLKQYGLAHKPMFVVPNHLVVQWTREFKHLYPNANLLMATKKDLEKQNRMKFVGRVATGDWDAVIISASSFEKIPLSSERQKKKLDTEIANIEAGLEEARNDGNKNRLTIKNLEKTLRNKRSTLEKIIESKPKDDLIKFEDLGVDYLFVDEAHKYKNKFIYTKMNNVAGISQAMSQRSTDLDIKTEFINEINKGEKGVVFATGTPISNSMVEMYTMQSYLQRKELTERGLQYFDNWAANFGETQTTLELAPSGQGYRAKTRFAKFVNLPELLTMYHSFADVKTAEMLNLPVPKINRITVMAQPSESVLKLNNVIQERAEKIYTGAVDSKTDNMLKITSDGKKLALDPRCYDKQADDDMGNKVNLAVENIFNIWEQTKDSKKTQIVFCDMSVPKIDFDKYVYNTDFDVYNDIKHKLVQKGVPEHEIRFIHEANTDLRKQVLFDDVRHGNVRIILGSTEKCGAGTNMQDNLIALHHLDTPYRPSDLAQREGRIVRQGNTNEEVFLYTYVTERTFDSYSYQILENKQKFIAQIDRGDLSVREASDIDETTLSYAEIKAITTANPKIKQKMELEQEITRLQTLESQYRSKKYSMQDLINKDLPQRISQLTTFIDNLKQDIEIRNANKQKEFSMQIGSKTYNERKVAGDIFLPAINSGSYDGELIAKMSGFGIMPQEGMRALGEKDVMLCGHGRYLVELSTSEIGSLIKLENFIESLDKRLVEAQANLENCQREIETARQEVVKPFEYAELLLSATEQLSALDAELDLNKEKIELNVVDDEEFKNEVAENPADEEEPEVDEEDIEVDSNWTNRKKVACEM